MQGVDQCGLDDFDRRLLRTIIETVRRAPVAWNTRRGTLREDSADTLEDFT
jgi:Holliday junction resolvasome RuvABC ATP-dependent DNA helicase subunit